ncbi:fumarylacetoacetate hydrolase family protein [Jeotgalibacillus marinus]|uniref:Fumarylacetoacetate hydrolase family protein n=1 Tax=Jeotgalibacillus marinus TaxID=86667 RepID=A0ABV3Q2L1_9BACL
MKFITFHTFDKKKKAGWMQEDNLIIDMHAVTSGQLPSTILELVEGMETFMPLIQKFPPFQYGDKGVYLLEEVQLDAPIPRPVSIRDFYAFEAHVKTARARRGLGVVPEWYDFPVFYFTNHMSVTGPYDFIVRPPDCQSLDYELEIACVIGKEGKNISASDAKNHIFGFCIMNDWSARDLQREEMKVGLGPAKGKDFATSFGPFLVTLDELESFRKGEQYHLEMIAKVNGIQLSKGNVKDLYYTFGEMIERASNGVTLYPGEMIGSGTVGSGCILELGEEVHPWLEPGDEISLSIVGLGTLTNRIIEERRGQNVLSSVRENST